MYIVSFNIKYVDTNTVVLTESPYLFVNENLRPIIDEIRKLKAVDFIEISKQMKIPTNKLVLGMTTFDGTNMHFFEVNIKNVR